MLIGRSSMKAYTVRQARGFEDVLAGKLEGQFPLVYGIAMAKGKAGENHLTHGLANKVLSLPVAKWDNVVRRTVAAAA